jgi:hypothetical protein
MIMMNLKLKAVVLVSFMIAFSVLSCSLVFGSSNNSLNAQEDQTLYFQPTWSGVTGLMNANMPTGQAMTSNLEYTISFASEPLPQDFTFQTITTTVYHEEIPTGRGEFDLGIFLGFVSTDGTTHIVNTNSKTLASGSTVDSISTNFNTKVLQGERLWVEIYETDTYLLGLNMYYGNSTYPSQISYGGTVFVPPAHTLMITSTVGGTTEPVPGNYTYAEGTNVQVTAIPDTNHKLAYWELDGSDVGSKNPITVLMNSNHKVNAVFELLTYNKLTILSSAGGTTNLTAGTHYYVTGSSVNVSGIPNSGYSFDYWLLDGEERTENPIAVIMDTNHTLEAVFIDNVPPEIGVPTQEPSDNITPYKNVTVTVNVTDLGTGVHNVTLWYSINNGTTWTPLNMTESSTNAYQATIPGYANCTWITYRIIAYDNAGNLATNNNNGYDYKYYVIPEFPSLLILPLFLVATLLAVIVQRRKIYHVIIS